MAQWTSVCTHAGTDYGFASTCSIVEYAVSGTPLRPCIHVAMVRTILLTKLVIFCNFSFFLLMSSFLIKHAMLMKMIKL